MVSGEEADAVLDWLRAVRRALASGTGAAMAVPPAFGKPVDVPFDALDCYPGAESSVILDWLRAVRRALASGTGAAMAVPPAFGKPVDVPFDALDCYPGAESSVIVMDGERIEGDWVSDGEGASFVGDRGGDLTRVDLLWGVDVSWKRSSVIVMDGERIEGDWVSDGEGASFVGDRGGDLTRVDLLWGVDVSWKRGLVFNARIESALSGSGLWSEAVENGRCIVPVRAFYETRNVEGGTGSRKPQYRFSSAGGTALLLAGLRLGDRFVLVTCEPDAVVGRVHSRMPLSLTAPEALGRRGGARSQPHAPLADGAGSLGVAG